MQSLHREVHLVFVGPDEDGLMSQLQTQARRQGCEEKMHFAGLLNKQGVISALTEGNLLLMPSEIQENFGMAALEAMAVGLPILVSECVPVGRWAQMVGAGRAVPCTRDAFQRAALELLSKPEQLRSMGYKGKDLARRNFDVSIVSRYMMAHFKSIVTTGRPLQNAKIQIDSISI
jgi:glycosyltransferase involved in cell wall biosynthesis